MKLGQWRSSFKSKKWELQTLIKEKKNRNTNALMNAKQNLNQDSMKRKITLEVNNSKMINNFKNDYETSETKTQSKTDKTIDTQKKTLENIPNKKNLENLKNLKCLSTEKLLKIENHNFNNSNNHDEILSNSYEEKNENKKKKE